MAGSVFEGLRLYARASELEMMVLLGGGRAVSKLEEGIVERGKGGGGKWMGNLS